MAISPSHKTLKRRSGELKIAAAACIDEDAQALLLFYAAECILKAYYLIKFSLKSTASENALAQPARLHAHRLDSLLTALRVRAAECPARPSAVRLKNGTPLEVGQLHEAWRYGEKVDNRDDILAWLNRVITYAEARV